MWQKQILTKAFINAFIWLIWGDVYRYLATATMVWTLLQTLQCPSWKVSTTPPCWRLFSQITWSCSALHILRLLSLPCRADLSWTKVKDSPRHPLCMTLCHLVLPLLTLRKLRPLPPPGTSLPEDWAEHSADSQAVLNLPENSIVGIRIYFDWGGQVHEEEGHWEHQPCTFCHKEVHAPPSQSK